jgi:hypothetical protein
MSDNPQHDPDSLARILLLTFGTMDHGGPYWTYVAVKPSRYQEFLRAVTSKQYDMQNFDKDAYGEVVVSGEGRKPPTDVTRKVAKMFDVPIRELFKDDKPEETIRKKIEALGSQANAQ